MFLNTAEAVNTRLVPLIRSGRCFAIITDHDAGRADLAGLTVVLGAVGVPLDAMTVANINLIDPRTCRTWKLTVLAVAKAELPPRLPAHVVACYGTTIQPGQDIVVLTRRPEE